MRYWKRKGFGVFCMGAMVACTFLFGACSLSITDSSSEYDSSQLRVDGSFSWEYSSEESFSDEISFEESIEESSSDETSFEESIEESSSDEISFEESSSEEDSSLIKEALNFSPTVLTEQYGYQQFAKEKNGEKMQKLYEDLYELCIDFSNSNRNIKAQTIHYVNGNSATVYEIGSVNFGQYNLTDAEAIAVWSIAMIEYPEFYWLSHSIAYSTTELNIHIDSEYAYAYTRQGLDKGLQAMAEECYGYIDVTASQTEIALSIEEYIVGNITYAYESDGVTPEDACWAHNLEGLVKGYGVCESYAKVYDYLCGLMGVNCITVSGMGGSGSNIGGHAWNMVELDGVWYQMDLTWEDAYKDRAWIGVPSTEFLQTHMPNTPENGYGTSWLYALPTASEARLQPVAMSKNNGKEVFYTNLDVAFAMMDDKNASYVINLCPTTKAGQGKGVEIAPYAIEFSTQNIPVAKRLTLTGKYVTQNNQTVITAKNAIIVQSNLTVSYATIEYPYGSSGINSYLTLGIKGSKRYAI